MPKDNYVKRQEYKGLEEVDGQVIPKRGDVEPEKLVTADPDDEGANNNGGGDEKPKRRRRNTVEDEE